jgi:thioredoxin reductase (NADPH)
MSYRGDALDAKRVKYWLRPELEWLVSKGRIRFLPRTCVDRIDAHGLWLRQGPDKPDFVPADDVLLLTGYEQDPTLFEQIGIDLEGEERAPRFDAKTMRTNIDGVYVAGTAAGGSQRRARLFIENSHVHIARIVRDLTGRSVPWAIEDDYAALEES